MKLFWDTETTGLPQKGLPDNHPSQPKLVQLGALLTDDYGVERAVLDVMVKPNGWVIPEATAKIHGITTELATQCGVPLTIAVGMFLNLLYLAEEHGGHNIEFDIGIIRMALAQLGRPMSRPWPKKFCTKEMADPFTKIPPTARMKAYGHGNKFKAPSLSEATRFFFDEELDGAHNAMIDVRGCARVYWHIKTLELGQGRAP